MSVNNSFSCICLREKFFHGKTVWWFFILSIFVTLWVAYLFHKEHDAHTFTHFNDTVMMSNQEIRTNISTYYKILNDGISMYKADEYLDQKEWETFIELQDLAHDYPGVQNLGMVLFKTPNDFATARFLCIRPLFNTIDFEKKLTAVFTAPPQRQTIERSRETGLVSLSKQTYFPNRPNRVAVMYKPIYQKNRPLRTPDERKKAFIGFVYVSLNLEALFKNIHTVSIYPVNLEIYESEYPAENNLLYRSARPSRAPKPKYETTQILDLYGEKWTLRYTSTAEFDTKAHYDVSIIVGTSGVMLNLLLLWALLSTVNARRQLKKEDEKFIASKNRLQTILDSATEGVHILDADGKLVAYSHSFLQMLGYSEEEAPHLNIHKWDAQFSANEIQEKFALAAHSTLTFETRHRRKDGTVFDVEIRAKAITLDRKWHLYCSARDITDRKKRLEELKMLYALIDDSYEMIFIIRLDDGYIEYVNRTGIEMTGYTLEELRSIGVEGFRRPIKQDETFMEHLAELRKAGRLVDYAYVIRKDGTEFPVEVHVRASRYNGIDYNIAISRDITEREESRKKIEKTALQLQEREQSLRRMNEHLAELVKEESDKIIENEKLLMQQSKMAAMGEMVGMIAHQWRQPLNAVSAASIKLKMLSEYGTLSSEELKETLSFIEDMLQKMSGTINDFMNFAKPDRVKESFLINTAIKEALKIIDAQLLIRNIALDLQIEDELRYDGYQKELVHVLLNCISNARDAFEQKEIEYKTITVKAYREADHIIILIGDNAGGIDESIMERIFDPFFTTKESDNGTGLGLYMSRLIIKKHFSGTISAKNTGNGAEFKIDLPLFPGDTAKNQHVNI